MPKLFKVKKLLLALKGNFTLTPDISLVGTSDIGAKGLAKSLLGIKGDSISIMLFAIAYAWTSSAPIGKLPILPNETSFFTSSKIF